MALITLIFKKNQSGLYALGLFLDNHSLFYVNCLKSYTLLFLEEFSVCVKIIIKNPLKLNGIFKKKKWLKELNYNNSFIFDFTSSKSSVGSNL